MNLSQNTRFTICDLVRLKSYYIAFYVVHGNYQNGFLVGEVSMIVDIINDHVTVLDSTGSKHKARFCNLEHAW
jgi:hypothetical protein